MPGKAVGWRGSPRRCGMWWPASSPGASTARRRCGRWKRSTRSSGWEWRARHWRHGGWRRHGPGSAGGCARRPTSWLPPAARRCARRWRRWRQPAASTTCRPPPRPCVRGRCRRPRPARSSPPPRLPRAPRRISWRWRGRRRCRSCRSAAGRCGPRVRPRWRAMSGSGLIATCATGAMARGRCGSRPGCVPTTGPRCWPPSTDTTGTSSPPPAATGGGNPSRLTPPTPWWRWPRGVAATRGAGGPGPRARRPRRPGAGPHRGGRDL